MAKRGSFPRERHWTVYALATASGRSWQVVERVRADTPNLAVIAAETAVMAEHRIDSIRVTHLVMDVDVLDKCCRCGSIITPHDRERPAGAGKAVCSECASWTEQFA